MNIPVTSVLGRRNSAEASAWTIVETKDHPAGICVVVGDKKETFEVVISLSDIIAALRVETTIAIGPR